MDIKEQKIWLKIMQQFSVPFLVHLNSHLRKQKEIGIESIDRNQGNINYHLIPQTIVIIRSKVLERFS